MSIMKKAAIIGGGIFGLYCAVELLRNNFKVDIYEQTRYVGQGASRVNQARLHLGYHYPRSKETALQSMRGFYKFQERFPNAINNNFIQYYAIARENSKTAPDDYISFCKDLDLPYKIVKLDKNIINEKFVDLCVEVPEVAFEYNEIINQLVEEIRGLSGRILLNHKVISGDVKSKLKRIEYEFGDNKRRGVNKYDVVVNASYSNINGLNHVFGLPKESFAFEMCELALVSVPQEYNSIGVTIMDGNFCAIMPYGFSGYQTISDVRRTPHERSDRDFPIFQCNKTSHGCNFNNINVCTGCSHVPSTNFPKMVSLAQRYIPYAKHLKLIEPMFMVKTILNYVENTDARPSKIYTYKEAENYFVLFAGKIDTVIDMVEELVKLLKR